VNGTANTPPPRAVRRRSTRFGGVAGGAVR
jgi:hypothetical protein